MKRTKIDLSTNDRYESERMISAYQKSGKVEVPLRINERVTILVPPEKCNEKYRQEYINKRI